MDCLGNIPNINKTHSVFGGTFMRDRVVSTPSGLCQFIPTCPRRERSPQIVVIVRESYNGRKIQGKDST